MNVKYPLCLLKTKLLQKMRVMELKALLLYRCVTIAMKYCAITSWYIIRVDIVNVICFYINSGFVLFKKKKNLLINMVE